MMIIEDDDIAVKINGISRSIGNNSSSSSSSSSSSISIKNSSSSSSNSNSNSNSSNNSILLKFQRDLNRISDPDRMTRKRGLQKLLDDLPWGKRSQRDELNDFIKYHLLPVIITHISDTVEKCREVSVEIIKKCLEKCDSIDIHHLGQMIEQLCSRVNEVPFPEASEEIRLQVLEIVLMIKIYLDVMHNKGHIQATERDKLIELMLQSLCKVLSDSFPSVKRICAEIICSVVTTSPVLLRSYYKQLLKTLLLNATHQHSKTRVATLQAIGQGLICLSLEDYQQVAKEHVLSIYLRATSDRTAMVRSELGIVIGHIIHNRIDSCVRYINSSSNSSQYLLDIDYEMIVVMFLLHGDLINDVVDTTTKQLRYAVQHWVPSLMINSDGDGMEDVPIHCHSEMIEDGEVSLRQLREDAINSTTTEQSMTIANVNVIDIDVDIDDDAKLRLFVSTNIYSILPIILNGIGGWTSESRKRYLRAMDSFMIYTDQRLDKHLEKIISVVGSQIKDDDADVRSAAELCCNRIGQKCAIDDVLDILLSRISGFSCGVVDSPTTRAGVLGVLTHVMDGFKSNSSLVDLDPPSSSATAISTDGAHNPPSSSFSSSSSIELSALYVCTMITTCLSEAPLYATRDASLRESILLLIRRVILVFRHQVSTSSIIQERLLLGLLFICGKCPGEDDVVPEVGRKELQRLSEACSYASISLLLKKHHLYLLRRVILFDLESSSSSSSSSMAIKDYSDLPLHEVSLNWDPSSPALSAFTILIRECPEESWVNINHFLPLLIKMMKPKAIPIPGSAEANALSYASQRGEEVINTNIGVVDVRLNLIALLESLIRAGTTNWECSQHIANASESIIKHVLIPNLIWRVGRVEGTVRKVALATCYGILKAGAVKPDTLFNTASELVPLIVSHLDDNDLSPRQMSCLCITVLFERLRGAFSEQSIREMYPKLLSRLDDSSDTIRVGICHALVMFLQCGTHKKFYSGTTIDYTLDQLFIHLDDPDPEIQQAVFKVIIQASEIDKQLVLKKAERNVNSHRTPTMCNKVIFEVSGMEILQE